MTDGSEAVAVTSLTQLIQEITVKLVGITYYKVSGAISDDLSTNDVQVGELTPTFHLKMIAENDEIGIRLSLNLAGDVGTIEVDLAANYVTPFPVVVPEEIRLEFANEVGVMALIPFIRETVFSISQRVFGEAVLMPIFQRGEIGFTAEERSP